MPADLKDIPLPIYLCPLSLSQRLKELIRAVEYSDEMYLTTFYTLNHSENFADKGDAG